MYEININLLPGIAEKERRLRESRQKILMVVLLVVGNLFMLLLTMFFIFHNSSLENNLNDLKNKIAAVKTEIGQYAGVERVALDLKTRIAVIDKIRQSQTDWENLLEVISQFTVKTVQYNEIRPDKASIKISGITKSWLDLEKNKNALATAVLTVNYLVQEKDTWERIAKLNGYAYDAFIVFHNIDPSVPPQPGKVIKIKKQVFANVQVISMIQQADRNNNLPFTLELTLLPGVI